MSIVSDVKFTWVIISSDNEISINLRYLGQGTSPPITVIATALTNNSQASDAAKTVGETPNSLTIKVEGASSLYDADLITVVASPYGSVSQPNQTLSIPSSNEPTASNPPSSNEPAT